MRIRYVSAVVTATLLVGGTAAVLLNGSSSSATPSTVVRRSDLRLRLMETGVLKPAESITYRSPLVGREAEVLFLAPEGARVSAGDVLVRLDTTELESELQRARQALRQAEIDMHVAEIARQQSELALDAVTTGEAVLSVDEARSTAILAEKRVRMLREDYEGLMPLLEKGYVTREELNRAGLELATAEAGLELARRKADMLARQSYPADRRKAALGVAEREAQIASARPRLDDARHWAVALEESVAACEIRARGAGLVTYETNLVSSPLRKVRVGDRVTSTQGLVTIPAIDRFVVLTSVREVDLYRVRAEQEAMVRVDAFPDIQLRGRVARIGTLAGGGALSPPGGPGQKRFDIIVDVDRPDPRLRPEMTATVEVNVGERQGALLVPKSAVFEQGGLPVVTVLQRWGHQTRVVELGEGDDAVIEVRAGLREGDRLSLVEIFDGSAAR